MATPGVHLIGSVPLPDAESVFRTVSEAVGPPPFALRQWELIDKEGTAS